MNRVAVTGIGVVSAFGAGTDLFVECLKEGEPAFLDRPRPGSETETVRVGIAEDFSVASFLPTPKNYLDRNSELAFAAFSLGLADAGLGLEGIGSESPLLAWATAYGGLDTMDRFFSDVHKKGPRFARPVLFPHAYNNTAVSLLSIEYKLGGEHLNFCQDWLAASQAFIHAFDRIRTGHVPLAFVGASEAMSDALLRFCIAKGWIGNGSGIVPAEAGVMLVLEAFEHAISRGADIKTEILGAEMTWNPDGWTGPAASEFILRCMNSALRTSGKESRDVTDIFANTCGLPALDRAEAAALVSFVDAPGVNVHRIKETAGETFGASGILNAAAACGLIGGGTGSESKDSGLAVLNNLSLGGGCASIVLGKA
jgi:3-oxoacyl-(acyl-carrier-protein) synthase